MHRVMTFIAAMLCLLAMTGCLPGLDGTSPLNAGPSAPPPVKITIWNLLTNDRRQEVIHESILKFNRTHRDVQVVPYYFENEAYKNKLRVAMLSNNMPDVFYFWSGESFKRMVDSQVVADLTGMLETHPDFRQSLIPEALQSAAYDGRVYGIPHSIQHVLIWYSKPVFAEYGLRPPETWAELTEIVKALNAKGVPPIAVAGKERWPLLHWYSYLAHRLGGSGPFMRAIRGEGDFKDPSFVEAAELFHAFVKSKAFLPGYLGMDQPQAEQAFLSGETAMFMQGDWAAARMLEDSRQKGRIGYFRFPTVNGKGNPAEYQGGYAVGWAISKTADLKAAFEVLSFLMQPEERRIYVEASGTPSTLKNLDISPDRVDPSVYDYLQFIGKDPEGYFGFYDQDSDYRRAQLLLDAVATFAGEAEIGRREIEDVLGNIK
jgi:raffinose/stachyose/melibiose transport system substrate-binding protein